MDITEKIKTLREANDLSQEKMAELMNMSKNSYGKLERGEVEINIKKLKRIAHIFNVDISELINEKGIFYYIGDNSSYNYHQSQFHNINSNENFNEIIQAKNEIIERLKAENELLKELLEIYKKSASSH